MSRLSPVALAALALAAALPAAAQRRARENAPTGAEIAEKARAARLDRENAVIGEFQGKKITFTPAVLGPRQYLAVGQVIGVLENDVAGDETGLPPGKYNILAAKLADGWHVYAESGGQIRKEAVRVRVETHAGRTPDRRPRFRAKGWGLVVDVPPDTIYPPPVATVTVTPTTATMLLGGTRRFFAELRDATGWPIYDRDVSWTSSSPAVAAVSPTGVATAMGPGTATVTATSEGTSGSAIVTVPMPEYWVSISGGSRLSLGQPQVYTATVNPRNFAAQPALNLSLLSWASSNPAVATVTRQTGTLSATVTPVAAGTTIISAVYTSPYLNVPDSMRVTVTRVPVASVNIAPASVSIVAGQTTQLAATVRDATGAVVGGAAVAWTSDNSAVAEVNATGLVTGRTPGSTSVTATSAGVSGTAAVAVTPAPVDTVIVTPSSTTVTPGDTVRLTATLRDARGNELTGRAVEWATSEPAIADLVAPGLVLAGYGGTATIKATSEGKSGTAQVYVPPKSSPDPVPTTTTTLSFDW